MLGAIVGDIVGSRFEGRGNKDKNFQLFTDRCDFTDDTVMTIAVASAISKNLPYQDEMIRLGKLFPYAGFGGHFFKWLHSKNPQPYNSWANGSAMRVSPIAWMFNSKKEVLAESKKSAEVSHSHPEGIKGAQAVALATYMARKTYSKSQIRKEISKRFDYDLNRSVEDIRPTYEFQISCKKSVPEAIICFLDSTTFEDAIRNAASLGGDSDTQAAIAGGIAEAYYGVDVSMLKEAIKFLPVFLLKELESIAINYIDIIKAELYNKEKEIEEEL